MSAIAGIYNVNGAPVDEELLSRMRDIVDYRGPDGSGVWRKGKVGFAHRLLWTTEESVHEKQPLTNGRGLWITADCRIDNREELKREFESRGVWSEIQRLFDPFPPPDSAYILFAYQIWNEDSPNHLLGDFAFAVWDERRQRLFCARDQIGIKPFVYHWNGRKFLFGSEMKQVFQDASVPEDLNILHLADILAMSFPNREETPYQAIRRLPPAHSLVIQKGVLRIQRYWEWNPDSEPLSPSSLEENAEQFLDLFKEAVQVRLRAPQGWRTGSLLSGGLDSSSIVSVAASFKTDSHFPVFNLQFPEANSFYQRKNVDPVDESSYVEALVQQYGLEFHPVEIRGWGPFENLEENIWHQEMPLFFPNLAYFSHLFNIAQMSEIRVLLNGEAGDELFLVGSRCRMDDRRKNILSLIPNPVKIACRQWAWARRIIPKGFRPSFVKEIRLRERAEKDFRWDLHAHHFSSYGILSWLKRGNVPLVLETTDRAAATSGIEVRFPFLDLRLLRFMAGLPWDQKVRGRVKKFLLRRALKDFLPPLIQNRLRKSEFTPVVRMGLERYSSRAFQEAFGNPHPILNRMVNPRKVGVLRKDDPVWFHWFFVSVDQWFKRRGSSLRKEMEDENESKQKSKLAEIKAS